MAVEVRYHVVRDGQEVAVYLTKKEADEHDKMLDIAFELAEYLALAPKVSLDEDVLEELCVYLAQNRGEVMRILRAQKARKASQSGPPGPRGAAGQPPDPQAKKSGGQGKPSGGAKKK